MDKEREMTTISKEDFDSLLERMETAPHVSKAEYDRATKSYNAMDIRCAFREFLRVTERHEHPYTEDVFNSPEEKAILEQWSWFYAGWCWHRDSGVL